MEKFKNWLSTNFEYWKIELSLFWKVLVFALIGIIITEGISSIIK